MPELPEVEVTRIGMERAVVGQHIRSAAQGKPLRWPLGADVGVLTGQRILGLRRRGKYVLMDLDRGVLLWHLGMSGSIQILNTPEPRGPHDHFDLQCETVTLRLHDPRRFGAVVYAVSESAAEATKLLQHLGVEPLTEAFNGSDFHASLRHKKASIKQVLLSGELVVGVGNIYASEALFRAGIHPMRAANRISRARVDRLVEAIKGVLTRAIAAGGSSLKDFRHADGELGYFQLETRVYDRNGLPCFVCDEPIKRIVQGQRATYYCKQCQT
ncbi:MAG: putative formamidopyrimidine-DNA glycosylase [Pseudomonadota bacterium]